MQLLEIILKINNNKKTVACKSQGRPKVAVYCKHHHISIESAMCLIKIRPIQKAVLP